MRVIDRLRYKMDIFNLKKHYLCVGRAATAIYLILCNMQQKNMKVLVPANICYAAIYPIIYSGNIPVFCDVEAKTGNVSLEEVERYVNSVQVMIIPHMFGNPVGEIAEIANTCRKHNIILIEDCASAMGAKLGDEYCGIWGDYTIFSTGYSKTIDLGIGGIVISDRDLSPLKEHYQKLPRKTEQDEENEAFFSKMYRLIRNNKKQTLDKHIWAGLYCNLQSMFVHRIDDIEEMMKKEISKLPEIIMRRKSEWELYNSLLRKSDIFEVYSYGDGAVPWRFNLLIQPEQRDKFIEYLLKREVAVSDWYPVVISIFGEEGIYKNATFFEHRIVNFPLLVGESKIKYICERINGFQDDNRIL